MEYRKLGNTDLRPSVLGIGCTRIGRSVFHDSRARAGHLLEEAFDAGVNLFDTAATYSYGDSERILGQVFASRRDRVIFATKGGYQPSSYAYYAQFLLPIIVPFRQVLLSGRAQLKQRSRKRQDFSIRHLSKQVDDSLRRLRTDYLDLYQLHSPPTSTIESDEVLRFLEDLVTSGKSRYCGASVNTESEAQLCLKYRVYSVLQVSFNLAEQGPTTEVLPLARAGGVGVIVKTPLARGLLTENYRVLTGPAPESPTDELLRKRSLALKIITDDGARSVTNAALRFVLYHADVTAVLTGTTDPEHLRANIAAVESGPLPERVTRAAGRLHLT